MDSKAQILFKLTTKIQYIIIVDKTKAASRGKFTASNALQLQNRMKTNKSIRETEMNLNNKISNIYDLIYEIIHNR